ncbi:FCP1 homology domain [Dillenia turbinata]|uniref:FCP1 homology domain n=1 Tax=Dillenia turbinata TaxID=194707 RepID=A0AAN8USK7_9MAGN
MPALKMKTKSGRGCLKEKNGLHVCQKSSVISKIPSSNTRTSHKNADLDFFIHDFEDVSARMEIATEDGRNDEAVDNRGLIGDETLRLEKPPSASCEETSTNNNPISFNMQECSKAAIPANLETIFSPILGSSEVHPERNMDDDTGNISSWLDHYCNFFKLKGLPDLNSLRSEWSNIYHGVPEFKADDSDGGSRSSCNSETCNVTDFYISDMIVSCLPFDGDIAYDANTDTNPFPGYTCAEPSLLFDVAEQYMLLPVLEETVETRSTNHPNFGEEAELNSDDCLYVAIHQMNPHDQDTNSNLHSELDEAESFDPHLFIKNLPDLSDAAPSSWPSVLPKETRKRKHITLVLDLDETLVHSTLEHCDDADFTFPVFFNMKEHTVYVKQRPYLQTFLERVALMFEVVIFTASQSIYAEQLLNILDPDGMIISRRAYRESCIFSDGSYTKDLTVLGVDLAKVAIIDNSPQVFRLQVNNGIPIKSWFDDPSDSALLSLLPFLETLIDADDVRPIIAKKFGNKE